MTYHLYFVRENSFSKDKNFNLLILSENKPFSRTKVRNNNRKTRRCILKDYPPVTCKRGRAPSKVAPQCNRRRAGWSVSEIGSSGAAGMLWGRAPSKVAPQCNRRRAGWSVSEIGSPKNRGETPSTFRARSKSVLSKISKIKPRHWSY